MNLNAACKHGHSVSCIVCFSLRWRLLVLWMDLVEKEAV